MEQRTSSHLLIIATCNLCTLRKLITAAARPKTWPCISRYSQQLSSTDQGAVTLRAPFARIRRDPAVCFRHVCTACFQLLLKQPCPSTFQDRLQGERSCVDHGLKGRAALNGLHETTCRVVAKSLAIINGTVLAAGWTVSNRGIGSHWPAPHLEPASCSVMSDPANPLLRSLWHAAKRKRAASSVGVQLPNEANAVGTSASSSLTGTGSMRGTCLNTRVASSMPKRRNSVMYRLGRLVSGHWSRTTTTAKNATGIIAATLATAPVCCFRKCCEEWLQAFSQCNHCFVAGGSRISECGRPPTQLRIAGRSRPTGPRSFGTCPDAHILSCS